MGRIFLAALFTLAAAGAGATKVFDDGGVHTIDTPVNDNVLVTNATTVNLVDGGSVMPIVRTTGMRVTNLSVFNASGGVVNGRDLSAVGGGASKAFEMNNSTAVISGGTFAGGVKFGVGGGGGGAFQAVASNLVVTGGEFLGGTKHDAGGGGGAGFEVFNMTTPVVVSGGIFHGGDKLDLGGGGGLGAQFHNSTILITGGDFRGGHRIGVGGGSGTGVIFNGVSFDIRGGTFSAGDKTGGIGGGADDSLQFFFSSGRISGGTFGVGMGPSGPGVGMRIFDTSIEISGGSFTGQWNVGGTSLLRICGDVTYDGVDLIGVLDDGSPIIVGVSLGPTSTLETCVPTIGDLVDDVLVLDIASQGIEQSLLSMLDGAAKKIDDGKIIPAINKLQAFINKLEAYEGKWIEDASGLIADTQALINSL